MERFVENLLYSSRWLLAPIYFGLSLAVLALAIKFFQEVFHLLPHVFAIAEAELILVILSLIDMALVGGLLVMVMISGYENFVSQLDIDESQIDVRAVQANIERLKAENPQGSVVIQADKKATTETLIKVMDASRAAGVFDVSIAAQEG